MAKLPLIYGCPYPIWWTAGHLIVVAMFLLAFCHSLHVLYRFIKNKHKETSKIKYAIPMGIGAICTASMVFIFTIMSYVCMAICNGVTFSFPFLP